MSDSLIPEWVADRRRIIINRLNFVPPPSPPPPPKTKADALTKEYLADALVEFGYVEYARELDGLDVWFVRMVEATTGMGTDIVLYEHMGKWKCSSISKTKLFRPDY